jgi:adhesin/invasin
LNVDRSTVIATDTTVVKVTVGPRYIAGAEMQAVDVDLDADLGRLSQTKIHTATPVEIIWTLPKRLEGKTEAVLAATSGNFSAQVQVTLQPGPANAIRLALGTSDLRADGVSATELSVRVEDAEGNPIADAQLTATARGVLSPFEPDEAGGFHAQYRVPKDISPSRFAIVKAV